MRDINPYIYILSDYGEEGAEHVTATTNRLLLEEMIDENWSEQKRIDDNPHHWVVGSIPVNELREWRDKAKAELAGVLTQPDEELVTRCRVCGGINLTDGWGGMQLHVVRSGIVPI